MKAVLHYRASPGFRAELARQAAAAEVQAVCVDETDDPGFATEIADADVLLHILKPVTAAMMDQAPRLKLIQKLGVGLNTIDLDAARERGVAVANIPGVNSRAVAEMALTLMLAVLRRLTYFDPLVRAGEGWRPDLGVLDQVGEIGGRTVGLVGYGAVPQALAPVLRALGATLIYTARRPRTDALGAFCSLDQLVERADIVSLHIPLTPETQGLVDAGMLGRMKPGAILINTARGELVDEAALAAALKSGGLAGAGLDVFGREPLETGAALLRAPNLVLAPHVAWLTPETLARSLAGGFENCRRLRDGEPLANRAV